MVDLTSHELRNPLNATWQSAELVEASLQQLRSLVQVESDEKRRRFEGVLEEAEDAIESASLRDSARP